MHGKGFPRDLVGLTEQGVRGFPVLRAELFLALVDQHVAQIVEARRKLRLALAQLPELGDGLVEAFLRMRCVVTGARMLEQAQQVRCPLAVAPRRRIGLVDAHDAPRVVEVALVVAVVGGIERVEPLDQLQRRLLEQGFELVGRLGLVLDVALAGDAKPHYVLIEVATYPEKRALKQALGDLTLAYSILGHLPELLMLVLLTHSQRHHGRQTGPAATLPGRTGLSHPEGSARSPA